MNIVDPKIPYTQWLQDYNWHNDVGWQHLPLFIRRRPHLLKILENGGTVNSRYITYKLIGNRLWRKLHDDIPINVGYPPEPPEETTDKGHDIGMGNAYIVAGWIIQIIGWIFMVVRGLTIWSSCSKAYQVGGTSTALWDFVLNFVFTVIICIVIQWIGRWLRSKGKQ